jgi:putative transposase
LDDDDRRAFFDVLAQCCGRLDASVLAYCLMGNHYHLVLTTRRPNLSALMRHLNGVYAQNFNRRHGKVGHVFQGRFKSVLVDREAYFLELCRYVELNPVRADIVQVPQDWPWSSFLAHAGLASCPPWLDGTAVQGAMLGHAPETVAQQGLAARRYVALVQAAGPQASPWETGMRQQVFLGDALFVERMQAQASQASLRSRAVPRPQRSRPISLAHCLQASGSRSEALYRAHVEGGLTMTAIALEMGLSLGRVSQLVKQHAASTRQNVITPAVALG